MAVRVRDVSSPVVKTVLEACHMSAVGLKSRTVGIALVNITGILCQQKGTKSALMGTSSLLGR